MNQHISRLKKKANTLPTTPGVYLMKDHLDQVIYVGKAKSLKSRIVTYFRKNQQHTQKIVRMVHNIADFDTIHVDTELDALLLECQLIQQLHPAYNSQMNHSANYRYLDLSQQNFRLDDKRTPTSFGPFRKTKQLAGIFQLMSETYQLDSINHISRLHLEKQLPEIKSMTELAKWQEIANFFSGKETNFFALNQLRLNYLIDHWLFEKATLLEQELTVAHSFYQEIKRINDFWYTPIKIFSLPIILSDSKEINTVKYYQVHYGRLVHSKVCSINEVFEPLRIDLNFRPFTRNDLDPACILMNYQQHALSDKDIHTKQKRKKRN